MKVVEELQGKTIFSGTYTVAPDGQTMTVEGGNAKGGSNEIGLGEADVMKAPVAACTEQFLKSE